MTTIEVKRPQYTAGDLFELCGNYIDKVNYREIKGNETMYNHCVEYLLNGNFEKELLNVFNK